jgi:hypothetical protein
MTGEELSIWIWLWYSYAAAFAIGVMAGISIAQRMRRFRGYCPWISEKKCVYLSMGDDVTTEQRPTSKAKYPNDDRDCQGKP